MGESFRELASLDRVVHEPARLMIVAMLYPLDSADFLFLLRETGLTKGNLSAHLSKLEEAGYLDIQKGFRGKIPQTTYSLTAEGRKAYRSYRKKLKRAMENLPE
ncbi:MAG: winged helix-turn-helix domain-containing protein [Chloroflexota bacterium]|jgi:DNA-binding MarR family transcriptional regulator